MSSDHVQTESVVQGRRFLKMHGLRNHFVIVDAREEAFRPDVETIRKICDAQIGVGADQLVIIETSAAEGADAFMRLFNVDGREAEACGNATRCVAWLLLEESGGDAVLLQTLAGLLRCERAGDRRVRAAMGRVRSGWRDVPLAEERDTLHVGVGAGPLADAVTVSVGNPHAVYFVDDPAAVDLETLAPRIQADPLFPEQVNVGAAKVTGEASMELRVYERGAGLTMACGSGACAAVFAARARGLTGSRTMTVTLPGGDLDITLDDEGQATQEGPVPFCFEGRFDERPFAAEAAKGPTLKPAPK